ncbi:MAG TPA: hypothetical protein VMA53_15345, partial [Stellaceae bacterium]|nr:hypothetical protein [Stellaceae bacterium]
MPARRFLFDVSFDEPDKPASVRAVPEPTFTQAELVAARAQGEAEGRAQALAEAATMTETRVAEAIEALDRAVIAATEARAAIVQSVEQDAVTLLRHCLAKALPALCRKEPLAEFEDFIVRTLAEALDEPRLVIRVADALFDAVQERINPLAKANGYSGKLV